MSDRRWRVGMWAMAVLCATACVRAPYPAPEPDSATPLRPRGREPIDDADLSALEALAQSCEARASAVSVSAALGVTEQLRTALGDACSVDSPAGQPLRIVVRCTSRTLFAPESYALGAEREACGAVRAGPVSTPACVGHTLAQAMRSAKAVEFARVEAMVLGLVGTSEPAASDYAACRDTLRALEPDPSQPWSPSEYSADEAQTLAAQRQLALCRAATFFGAFSSARAPATKNADAPAGRIALLGSVAASDSGSGVLLVLQLVPSADASAREDCTAQRDDRAGLLQCLERCAQSAALGASPGQLAATTRASLFDTRGGRAEATDAVLWVALGDAPGRPSTLALCSLLGDHLAGC